MILFSIFSTREIVSAIYVLLLCIFIIRKKSIRSSLLNVIKIFFSLKIQVPIFLLVVYGSIPVLILNQLAFWKWVYIKDIIIWLICAGLPCCMNISDAKEHSHFKKIVFDNLKFSVFVEFIISSFTFNIFIELLLQPVLFFLVMLQATAESDVKYRNVATVINFLLCIIGIIILVSSMNIAIRSLTKESEIDLLISFLTPIIYSLLFLPCAYMLALYSEYELLFVRMKVVYTNKGMLISKKDKLLINRFWKIIKICRLSIKKLLLIDGMLLLDIYSAENDKEYENFISKLKSKCEENNMNNEKLFDRTGMKIFQFLLALIASIIATLAYLPQVKLFFHKPVHDFEISIPDVKVNEKTFIIPMVFRNYGDFDEILSNISLGLFDGEYCSAILSETDDIYLFQRKETSAKIFESEIDFQNSRGIDFEYLLENKTLSLELIFNFVTDENKHVTRRMKLGNVSINEDITQFNMILKTVSEKIDFSGSKETFIIQNYPRMIDYDPFMIKERK